MYNQNKYEKRAVGMHRCGMLVVVLEKEEKKKVVVVVVVYVVLLLKLLFPTASRMLSLISQLAAILTFSHTALVFHHKVPLQHTQTGALLAACCRC
jgi:hypothetical protein